jgi:hypothetical protein
MQSCFDTIKFEDRYVTSSCNATLEDFVEGRADWGPGILAMDTTGYRVVYERFAKSDWTKERIDAVAETMLATVMLTDHAMVMLHGNDEHGPSCYPGPWWRTPIWTPAHEKVLRLGGPLGKRVRQGNGGYRRQYLRGLVGVNPTTAPIVIAGIGTVAPESGKVVEG